MKPSDFRIQCFETNEEIFSLKDSWEELHKDCTQSSIYNSFSFIYELIQAFQFSEVTKKVFTLTDASTGQLIATFPFQKRKTSWKLIPYNTYETIVLNEIMDKPFPLIRTGFHDPAWIAFVSHLKSNVSDWDHLFLRDIPSSYPVLDLLPEICRDQNHICKVSYDSNSTEINVQGDWGEFWGKHFKMRKNIRKLERHFGDRLSFTVHDSDWKWCLDEYIALERKTWKNGLGVTKDEETITFYNQFCEYLNSTGNLKFGFVTVDGQLISAVMAYTHNDTVYIPQGCFDPAFKKHSPTMINLTYFLKYFYGTSYKKVDFLCGYAGFVNKWTDTKIETYDIDIYNKRSIGRLVSAALTLRDSICFLMAFLKKTFNRFAPKNSSVNP